VVERSMGRATNVRNSYSIWKGRRKTKRMKLEQKEMKMFLKETKGVKFQCMPYRAKQLEELLRCKGWLEKRE